MSSQERFAAGENGAAEQQRRGTILLAVSEPDGRQADFAGAVRIGVDDMVYGCEGCGTEVKRTVKRRLTPI